MNQPEPGRPVRPEPSLSYVIGRLDRALAIEVGKRVSQHGITLPQYTALSVLELQSGLSNAQLARRAFVRPQSMMQVVADLEEKKLIVRALEPGNGRILRTQVTPSGHELLKRCSVDVANLEREMLEGIGDAERDVLRKALISCVRRLGGGLSTAVDGENASA